MFFAKKTDFILARKNYDKDQLVQKQTKIKVVDRESVTSSLKKDFLFLVNVHVKLF